MQICESEGPHPFPRGDNNDIAKIHWRNFEIFSRTDGKILTTKHPWEMGSFILKKRIFINECYYIIFMIALCEMCSLI